MIGRIKIKLSIPFKVGKFYYYKSRVAGFSFDNLAALLICENNGIELNEISEHYKNNQNLFIADMIYAAYESYCMHERIKSKYEKEKVVTGFYRLSEVDKKRVLKTWERSEIFGVKKDIGSKKKVKG